MFCKTKKREGLVLQYTGDNLSELRETFPSLHFRELRSVTSWNGNVYTDLRVSSSRGDMDLIVGDYVLDEGTNWSILPVEDFEAYWEEV